MFWRSTNRDEFANADEYEAWNGDSGHRWVVDADRRDHILAPVADALLAAAHLSPGEATWQPLVANDWLTIPGAALLRYGSLPGAEASGRGMFAQSDAESVTATLHAAGYADPQFEPVELTLALGADPNEAVDYLAGTGPGRAVLDSVPDDQPPAALDAVRAVLADHAEPGGVRLGAAIWIITASNPT